LIACYKRLQWVPINSVVLIMLCRELNRIYSQSGPMW
jgi:hypothetical protein